MGSLAPGKGAASRDIFHKDDPEVSCCRKLSPSSWSTATFLPLEKPNILSCDSHSSASSKSSERWDTPDPRAFCWRLSVSDPVLPALRGLSKGMLGLSRPSSVFSREGGSEHSLIHATAELLRGEKGTIHFFSC